MLAIEISVRGKVLEPAVTLDQAGGGLRADPGHAGIPVGGVADEREIVGNPLRRNAELRSDARGVADLPAAPIDLDDAVPDDALAQVFVGRPDADLLDARVGRGQARRGGQRVVGLELDHGPADDAHRGERVLEGMELAPQGAVHSLARLVARPEVVAERFDDVVRRDADVRRAAFQHLGDGVEHARDRAEGRVLLLRPPDPVELAEELVGPVDEVDDHARLEKDIRPVDFGPGRSSSV